MRIGRRTLSVLGLAALLVSCTEDTTAPGKCPAFCPGGQLGLVDTVMSIISRDSSYVGYVNADSAQVMLAMNVNGIDSRPIFVLGPVSDLAIINATDTTHQAPTSVDSAHLTFVITRRDTAATNLTISLYRLPTTIGPTTTFADLAAPFTDSLIRTMNVDSLLKAGVDSVSGDSVLQTDSVTHTLRVVMSLDSAQAAYVAADSGRSAFGIRITADSLASVAITTVQGGAGPVLNWWATYDSSGVPVVRSFGSGANVFNAFVTNLPATTLDSNLVVGGVPSARTILRFAIPRFLRDSTQIVRATLYLLPVSPLSGAASDSVVLTLARVATDLGAKSPCASVSGSALCPVPPLDSSRVVAHTVPMGQVDTVAVEITELVRAWQADTTAPQTIMIRQYPEGGNLLSARFYSTRNPALKPSLHLTYVPRYRFGTP